MRISLVTIVLLFAINALTSCSPFYVMQAAYVESGILLRRQDISDVLLDPSTTDAEKRKLALVSDARKFALSIGLTPGNAFTKYSRVDSDVLAWVVMGSKPDAFELYTWWFPIVGSVPYKGFFSKDSADFEGQRLSKRGYEFFVRGTDAFSTLGWFNDPVLSTILKHSDVRIPNTIIHESLHSTVWIPNYVDFNESLANFVGTQGALEFYKSRAEACGTACSEEAKKTLIAAQEDYNREFEFADIIENLYSELNTLYQGPLSREEKLDKRTRIFEAHLAPLRIRYPQMKTFKEINNAEIMQVRVYLTKLRLFRDAFERTGSNWSAFLDLLRSIKDRVKDDKSLSPFELLQRGV